MTERQKEILAFLKNAKIKQPKIKWLPNDASGRCYARVVSGEKSYILMDSPANEKPDLFCKIDWLLEKHKINVPHIFQSDIKNGLILMEDLGKKSLADIYKSNQEKNIFSAYQKALDLLLKIQKNITKKPDFIPAYSNGYLSFEENLLTDWYVPALTGKRLDEKSILAFKKIWQKLNKQIQKMDNTLVLLDYHADNLMIQKDKMIALDFQDARWGGFLYDVISLLEDERHPLPEVVAQKLWDYYWQSVGHLNTVKNKTLGAILAVQRHTKVIGIFARLAVRDKKEKYLKYIPDSWKMLEKHLNIKVLKPYKKWLDKYVPVELRHQPLQIKPFYYLTTAMVLAAGRGVRMQNLTDHQPKPLVQVNQKSLIHYVLNHARHMTNIVVNTCYCGEMIHQELKDKKVKFSDEKTALETGGGVQKALPLLKKTGADGFFVINADALWLDKKEPLLKQMERAWNPLEMDVLLAFVPTKKAKGDVPKGDYFIKNGKPVRRHPPQKKAPYCFMGVQILHPDIFKGHPLKKYSLVEMYDKAEQNGRLACLIFDGLWFHVGTPKAVQDTTKYFKRKKV